MPLNTASFGRSTASGVVAITAGTTQTLAGSTAITAAVARVTTGNANDGVSLPVGCAEGELIWVFNLSGAALKVYPQATGSINAATAGNAHVQAASKPGLYRSNGNGDWVTIQGA